MWESLEVRTALTDAGLETITNGEDVERITGKVWSSKLFNFWEQKEWNFDRKFHTANLLKNSNIA